MEVLRNDPYYLFDKSSKAPPIVHDVDSIPVVKLDLDLPSSSCSFSVYLLL